MKRFKSILLITLAIMLTLMVGCKGKNEATSKENKKLTVAVNFAQTESTFKELEEIAKEYEKENEGIAVEIVTYPDYENTMQTKMGVGDLPDLLATHGWSVMRYGEYLEPLQNREWASKINSSIKSIMTDKDGTIYALPMDYDIAGVAFNKDVLDEVGVDPFKIKTWDDFKAACEKIKQAGKTPLYIGGSKDDWTIGNFFDWVAPSFLITNENKNYSEELVDGTFDWSNWEEVAQLLIDLQKSGYINKNINEGTWPEVGEQLAKGNAAFAFFGNYVIGEAKKFNENGNYGFMPVPSNSKDDEPAYITGERVALGVYKDSPLKEEGLKFIDFLAKPENVNRVAKVSGNPTGLVGEGYKTDAGEMNQYFEKAKDYRGFGYFDRVYLPSGMWGSLCKTGSGLVSGTMTPEDAAEQMKADYNKLRK
ncbi:ABC transporter substrate-binding protein [Oceanirhabdus seepicola]|uniref:Carbohydrate ABC transporter substrate-binding protein n=1 Tax=Oceanirhabdus seepicola TaxID=2828781 RepID=A0A9J6NW69_9CLOT|nr:ABC transporter substrate-binding protein [Oceanirhabdus seepicola]MCM1988308.1 carbohydrate ABC transporter substrate-binding protein [Oceanirhabdus seepicola]